MASVIAATWTCGVYANCLDETDAVAQPAARLIERDPAKAEALAKSELERRDRNYSPATLARLTLVLAAIQSSESRTAEAVATLQRAREQYKRIPSAQQTLDLKIRLLGTEVLVAAELSDYRSAVGNAGRLMAEARANSIEQACLLLIRADAYTELDQPDLGVADLLSAHRMVQDQNQPDATIEAELGLATAYRRGGLLEEARSMADSAKRLATKSGYRRLQSIGYFTSGQISVDERRWDDALAELQKAHDLDMALGDPMDAAFSTLAMCTAVLGAGRLELADEQCSAGEATFNALGRTDLATDLLMYQSRIALARRQYERALAGFNTILNDRIQYEPLRYLPGLYSDRATALSGLGRDREAAADYRRSLEAAEKANLAERARRVAVLNGQNKARALESANEIFQRENERQREQLATQMSLRRLSVGMAAAALIACALLALLFVREQRHRRAQTKAAATLRTLTDNLPDTVMLLDRDSRLQFANRALPGGDAPATGAPVESSLPAPITSQWRSFLDDVLRNRATRTLQLGWRDAHGSHRWTENSAAPVVTDGELHGIALRSTDVTSRRTLEEQLQLQARVLDAMDDGVIVIDDRGRPVFANERMYDLAGIAARDRDARTLESLGAAARQLQGAGVGSARPEQETPEVSLLGGDHERRLVRVATSGLQLADGSVLICVCHDISVQRSAERTLVSTTRLESLSISARLHEDLAQDLAGIAMLIDSVPRPPAEAGVAPDAPLGDISQHLGRVIRTARELATLLSPTTVVRGSVGMALSALARETEKRTGIPIRCITPAPDLEIDDLIADQLYLIARGTLEFLEQSYACENLHIELAASASTLDLRIAWDGRAHEDRHEDPATSLLEVLSYRCRLLGGALDRSAAATAPGWLAASVPWRAGR